MKETSRSRHVSCLTRNPYGDGPSLTNLRFSFQTALHMAIRFGDDDCVHYLITAGADRTAIDAEGQTVAHYLAETFNEDIYRDILFPPNETTASRQKVDLAVMNDEGDTAVHLAVKRKKLALLESLLEAEASINDVERNTGKSALHLAVEAGDAEAVELLLQVRQYRSSIGGMRGPI